MGGEEAGNAEVRERRSRRRRHAEERRRLLAEANASLDDATDDDGIMLGIYESIQDELRHKCKLLQREKQKVGATAKKSRNISFIWPQSCASWVSSLYLGFSNMPLNDL